MSLLQYNKLDWYVFIRAHICLSCLESWKCAQYTSHSIVKTDSALISQAALLSCKPENKEFQHWPALSAIYLVVANYLSQYINTCHSPHAGRWLPCTISKTKIAFMHISRKKLKQTVFPLFLYRNISSEMKGEYGGNRSV